MLNITNCNQEKMEAYLENSVRSWKWYLQKMGDNPTDAHDHVYEAYEKMLLASRKAGKVWENWKHFENSHALTVERIIIDKSRNLKSNVVNLHPPLETGEVEAGERSSLSMRL